jgi:hypothetical protein
VNIIRTTAVELTAIPAIAYKQKLATGGAGLKILRLDTDVSAVFTIDRRSGEATPFGLYEAELFPNEAVYEAQELTHGLPYTARGKIKITVFEDHADAEEAVAETDREKADMVNTPEYNALIERYTDEEGKLNYALMNKDFIQFASRSTKVGEMIGERANDHEIVLYVVASRVAVLAGNRDGLSIEDTEALIETLDEISLRSAFKELTLHIRRLLALSIGK